MLTSLVARVGAAGCCLAPDEREEALANGSILYRKA
jgi:hypothetical protein